LSVEKFVGKVVEFKIGETTFRMKCPSAKFLPKLMYLQARYSGKDLSSITEEDIEKFVKVIENCVQRTYPEWDEEERDDFVVQNFAILMEKLPLTLATEADLKKAKEKIENVTSKRDESNTGGTTDRK